MEERAPTATSHPADVIDGRRVHAVKLSDVKRGEDEPIGSCLSTEVSGSSRQPAS